MPQEPQSLFSHKVASLGVNSDNDDVPSPIDLRSMADARAWQATAMAKRPYRSEFFSRFAAAIQPSGPGAPRVLELGSGPGFLAEHLLKTIPNISYFALDFSAAMHTLAIARLGPLSAQVTFIERDFKAPDWTRGLEQFDFVIAMQAVHELRHKRHAPTLHGQVRKLLNRTALIWSATISLAQAVW